MEYREEQMWPLTGGTTCYTGIRDRKGATEWHTLHLTTDDTLSSRQITPRDNALVCVGYSTTANHECLVLLDVTRLDAPETPLDVQPATTTNNNDRGGNDWDDQSVSNATITTTTSTVGTRATSPENVPSQLMTLSFDSLPPPIIQPPQLTQAAALLMIRSLADRSVEFTKTLDYRPLSPRLCNFSEDCMGVWLGSSDHNELHLYVSRGSEWQAHDLSRMPEFQLTSPIMSIDFCPPNCLAVACQDGTIRVIVFQSFNGFVFSGLSQQQVMVDGPIVCLSLRTLEPSSKWLITAGSLCGYAMEWFVDAEHTVCNPSMIAKGFWNGAIAAEDSVLAVRSTDDQVLIGTQSGKVLLYGLDNNKAKVKETTVKRRHFRLLWQCQLPYSIHEVEFLVGDDERLLVTTRKSIHTFQKGNFNYVDRAAFIRSRLMTMMQQEIEAEEVVEAPPIEAADRSVSEAELPLEEGLA